MLFKQICELRSAYGFAEENLPQPELLHEAWQFLLETVTETYGSAVKRYHELPFRCKNSEGQLVTGFLDLIWETEAGYVIVDYKTCPGDYAQVFKLESEHFVGRHGDQLDCYEEIIDQLGQKPVLAKVIYYPVTRYMAEVK